MYEESSSHLYQQELLHNLLRGLYRADYFSVIFTCIMRKVALYHQELLHVCLHQLYWVYQSNFYIFVRIVVSLLRKLYWVYHVTITSL